MPFSGLRGLRLKAAQERFDALQAVSMPFSGLRGLRRP